MRGWRAARNVEKRDVLDVRVFRLTKYFDGGFRVVASWLLGGVQVFRRWDVRCQLSGVRKDEV